MEEGKLLEQITKGDLAKDVLENPEFVRVLQEVNRDFGKVFKGDDMDKALEARSEARALERVLTKLTKSRKAGETAAVHLEQLKERREFGLPNDVNSLGGIA